LEQIGGGLDEVLEAGILEQDSALVRFGQPLLGSLIYADATAQQRRHTHRLLAELLTEPEEQSLHLALGTQDPDERAAGRLEDAARRAAARGAPDAAAELAEHASRLTAVRWSPVDCRRRLAASNYHTQAGNGPRARALLQALIAHLPPERPAPRPWRRSPTWSPTTAGISCSRGRPPRRATIRRCERRSNAGTDA
jgi:hypothetical protein